MGFTTKMTEQFVHQMYQNNVGTPQGGKVNHGPAKAGKGPAGKNAQAKTEDKAAVYEKGETAQKPAVYSKPKTSGQSDLQAKLNETYAKLSTEAKEYLDSLKEKYGDIEFFVADCASDEEMNRYFEMGHKKYTCVISSETIEKMATDETARAKYEGIIDNADETLEEIREEVKKEVGEEAASQISFGFTIDDNGVVDYFAKLRDSNNSYYAKLKEQRAAAKEEQKKAEEKRAEKQKEERGVNAPNGRPDEAHMKGGKRPEQPAAETSQWLHADSKEGLIAAIKEALGLGNKTDMAVARKEAE